MRPSTLSVASPPPTNAPTKSRTGTACAAAGSSQVDEQRRQVFSQAAAALRYGSPVQRRVRATAVRLQEVQEHPEVVAGIRLGDRIYHSGIQGGTGSWSIVRVFLRLNPEQAEQFTEHLTTSAGLHPGHPLLMLRNRLFGSLRSSPI